MSKPTAKKKAPKQSENGRDGQCASSCRVLLDAQERIAFLGRYINELEGSLEYERGRISELEAQVR
jgi:hypothetical protein